MAHQIQVAVDCYEYIHNSHLAPILADLEKMQDKSDPSIELKSILEQCGDAQKKVANYITEKQNSIQDQFAIKWECSTQRKN